MMTRLFSGPKIAYLVKSFPRLSETFILNEILGIEKLGAQLHIFSLKRPEVEPVHEAVDHVKASVTYALSLGPRSRPIDALQVVVAHSRLMLRAPRRYWRTALEYFGRPGRPRVKEFIQAGYLAVQMERQGCTHVHAHFANAPTTVAELIQSFAGLPYSFTAHAKDIYLSPSAELDRKMQGAKFVLTCTAYNRDHLAGIHTGDTPIHLAYHGVDLTLFSPSGGPDAGAGSAQILAVGRLCQKKGFEDLIRACGLLRERSLSFHCTIVGDGPQLGQLQKLIFRLGLKEIVTLAGKMSHKQVLQYYKEAAVFALPCLITDDGDRDGIPNVLIEAMAMEIPVVSTAISGIGELIRHGENGLLIPQRDPVALADALRKAIVYPHLRTKLARAGRRTVVERFSRELAADRVWGLLCEPAGNAESREIGRMNSATVLVQ